MATTSPDNIWTPDATDDYALTADLATTASTIQTAITSVRNPVDRNQQFYGPTASMGSVTGMKRGDIFQESDGSFRVWRYDGSGWVVAPGVSHRQWRATAYDMPTTLGTVDVGTVVTSSGDFTYSAGTFTCVRSGRYLLAAQLTAKIAGAAVGFLGRLTVDESEVVKGTGVSSTVGSVSVFIQRPVLLTTGQTIQFQAYSQIAIGADVTDGATYTDFARLGVY